MSTSGERTKSLWMQVEVAPDAPRLNGNLHCDTVVVGSGIAGLSTAYELTRAGHKVIVVDRGPIAGGITARTTAHLAPICDDGLGALIDKRGEDTARLFQQSQEAAVARIEDIVSELGISCNFRRLDALLFPATGMDAKAAREQADKEYDAARKAGAAVERAKGVPLKGFEKATVLRYPNQATFHPSKYLKGLAAALQDKGARLFADTVVTKVEAVNGGVRIATDSGAIEATYAVVATNGPINDGAELHEKMVPYRTYAMAFTMPRGTLPDALYWDMADPYHYVRLNPGPGTVDYLIAGGADHKSGEADDGDVRFAAIEAWMRQLLPDLGNEVTRWSGQIMDTFDYCGLIGRYPRSENVFVVTGDSGQGMTHGPLGALLIRDLIIHGSSPWESVYDPARKPPKGLLDVVSENVTAIKNFAEQLMPAEEEKKKVPITPEELKPGEGGLIQEGESRVAVCRDFDGKLHLRSAKCTHLGCDVHWNSTEQCWDCPCHGSHFAPDGAVLNGPAIAPLEPAKLPARKRQAKAETA